ncbi:MAG: thiosulfate sulfurtransferase [Candidatus Marinimicrobia bacterium]|nr:thiosulfate sulfurtransferase [Candidatus Neomarinimicrobiota bacterium]
MTLTKKNSTKTANQKTIPEISTSDLLDRLNQADLTLVDIRPVDAYNGWPLQNEPRGGHLPTARNLPAKWFGYLDWVEIVQNKRITPDQSIVLYGYDARETEKVADLFRRIGFGEIMVYHHFLTDWSPNSSLPLKKLKRYQNLIPAAALKALLNGNPHPGLDTATYVVCHAHYQNPDDYSLGHIPGAIALDTLALESPETWNRRGLDELQEALRRHGITVDSTVILYGRFSSPNFADPFPGSSAGHLGAIRCAAILLYAGVKDVRVLNGGLQAWEDAGYELTKAETIPSAAASFGASIAGRSELFIDVPQAKELLAAEDGALVSVRSWPEFIGETSGYHYIEKRGRIPGAIFGNCGSDAYHMENYRNPDHTTREYPEIAQIWQEAGITPDKRVAFYCGTGWRGSEAFLNAWLMGWPNVAVFDGGWFEWSSDPENPIETGIPVE